MVQTVKQAMQYTNLECYASTNLKEKSLQIPIQSFIRPSQTAVNVHKSLTAKQCTIIIHMKNIQQSIHLNWWKEIKIFINIFEEQREIIAYSKFLKASYRNRSHLTKFLLVLKCKLSFDDLYLLVKIRLNCVLSMNT